MTRASLHPVVRHIRRMAMAASVREQSDAELLDLFIADRAEPAFAALVQRHGPLVWSVCWQVLHHRQDTEDAFQATFLLLARQAGVIRRTQAVASWLYRVAYRVATKAGMNMARQRTQERTLRERPADRPDSEVAWRELQALLTDELNRLPEKYRASFILCCLEGKSGPEAARLLGWKEGSVTGRLCEARKLLQRRLERRGVLWAAVASALAVAHESCAAALMDSVVRASLLSSVDTAASGVVSAKASALAEGVSKTMTGSKVKIAAILLVVGSALTASTGAWTLASGESDQRECAAARSGVQIQQSQTPAKAKDPAKHVTEAPALDPDDPLDAALVRWQQALAKIETANCAVSRTNRDNQLKYVEVSEGTFKYMKPKQWVLELRRKDKPEEYEKWARQGKLLYQYSPKQREVFEHVIPENLPEQKHATWLDRLLKSLASQVNLAVDHPLLGMKVEDVKRRYNLKISKGKEKDPYYIYIDVQPRAARDEADFEIARLVLNKDTHLPRQYWFRQPNGDETTWDIVKLETGAKLTRDDFKLLVPEGWKLKQLPRAEKDADPKNLKDK